MTTLRPDNALGRAVGFLAAGRRLGEELTTAAFAQLMRGEASPAQIAALLIGLRVQGETGEEVAGAARAIRDAMVRVDVSSSQHLIDTCGTGGGRVRTFNISTAAAVVAVGAGASVAKHGNRSFTSKCGSADVLEALGVELAIDAARAARQLAHTRMAFLFAPTFHPAMKFVASVRRELGVPTIMNLLGPLSNPAGVRRQVIGVADPGRAPLLAEGLRRLGAEHALVVHGEVGMDEIAPCGRTAVWEVRGDGVESWVLDPADYRLEIDDLSALDGGEPAANADRIRRLTQQPAADRAGRAAVTLNAGAALYVAGLARDVREGTERARAALDDGAAAAALERLVTAQAPGAVPVLNGP
ncbi:MAG: anthranilate phosphoribosyltransferase [Gemmatimonadetes bacterium]|nr:anthranilate phosphoribosyltransferase [Gemmatimonadota bacterium]